MTNIKSLEFVLRGLDSLIETTAKEDSSWYNKYYSNWQTFHMNDRDKKDYHATCKICGANISNNASMGGKFFTHLRKKHNIQNFYHIQEKLDTIYNKSREWSSTGSLMPNQATARKKHAKASGTSDGAIKAWKKRKRGGGSDEETPAFRTYRSSRVGKNLRHDPEIREPLLDQMNPETAMKIANKLNKSLKTRGISRVPSLIISEVTYNKWTQWFNKNGEKLLGKSDITKIKQMNVDLDEYDASQKAEAYIADLILNRLTNHFNASGLTKEIGEDDMDEFLEEMVETVYDDQGDSGWKYNQIANTLMHKYANQYAEKTKWQQSYKSL